MQPRTALLAAPIMLVIVLALLAPAAESQQEHEDSMTVSSRMLLTGFDPLEASGSARITLTGSAAVAARHAIFNLSDADGNQYLSTEETRTVLGLIAEGLEGKAYWGAMITSVDGFSERTAEWLLAHTTGLLDVSWDSDLDLSFPLEFSGEGQGETKMIEAAQGAYDAFAGALRDAVGYVFAGHLEVEHRLSTMTIGAVTNPVLESGELSGIRTPLGEVLWYSFAGEVAAGVVAADEVAYEDFSIKENLQIGFAVVFIGCFLILRMPGKNFDKFEKLHPKKFRRFARPLMSVSISAYVVAGLLVLLYVLPFAFSFASSDALFYVAYLYLLVPIAVVAEYFFSKSMYDRASLDIPEESVIEVKQAVIERAEGEGEMICKVCYRPIEAGLEIFQCACGTTMHVDCAEKAQRCPACGNVLIAEQMRSIQCKACGETFLYSGSDDAYSIQCTKCGAFQEEIKPGRNYLVVDDDPRNAFMMIRAIALSGRPAMVLTASFPGKIRSDYDLGEIPVKWLSDSTTDIDNVNPKDLDGDVMEIVSTFLMTTKNAGVLVDGIETLIEMNGFEKALGFVKRLNDLAAIHGSAIILSLNKKALPEEQFKAINEEFDEIHDYS